MNTTRFLVLAVCTFGAFVGAIVVFAAIFVGPAYFWGNDTLLWWGWIGWVPAFALAGLSFAFSLHYFQRSLKGAVGVGSFFSSLLLVALICLIAWLLTYVGRVDIRWKEQVALSSGEVVVVERRAIGDAFGMKQPDAWKREKLYLLILDPRYQKVMLPEWESPTFPVYLDFDHATQSWSLLSRDYSCSLARESGKPKQAYRQHVARQGDLKWTETPVDQKFYGRDMNLLVSPRSTGEPSLLTIQDKASRRNASPGSERIANEPSGC